jgi:hypothetical protein
VVLKVVVRPLRIFLAPAASVEREVDNGLLTGNRRRVDDNAVSISDVPGSPWAWMNLVIPDEVVSKVQGCVAAPVSIDARIVGCTGEISRRTRHRRQSNAY